MSYRIYAILSCNIFTSYIYITHIDTITPTSDDWQEMRGLVLDALNQAPHAFVASHDVESLKSAHDWCEWIEKSRNTHGECIIIAKSDYFFVGMVGAYVDEYGVCRLRSVYVRPSYRGKGIASRLVESVLETLVTMHIPLVELRVNSTQKEAVHLYHKFGFEVIGVLPDQLSGDGNKYTKLHMRKILTPSQQSVSHCTQSKNPLIAGFLYG